MTNVPTIHTIFNPRRRTEPVGRVFMCSFSECNQGFSTVANYLQHLFATHQCQKCGLETSEPQLSIDKRTCTQQQGGGANHTPSLHQPTVPDNLQAGLFGSPVITSNGGVNSFTYKYNHHNFENILNFMDPYEIIRVDIISVLDQYVALLRGVKMNLTFSTILKTRE